MVVSLNIVVIVLLFFYIFYVLKSAIKKTSNTTFKNYFISLALLHFSVSIIFAFFLDNFNIPDPIRFYNNALNTNNWVELVGLGNQFMSFIIYPFVKLGIRIEVLFLVFSTISFKGFLVYFELIGIEDLRQRNKILLLLFLVPSLHFWTGFLGKEALLFLLMALLLKQVKLKQYNWKSLLILISVFLIRPHVFFVLVVALVVLFLLDKNITKKLKRNLIVGSILIFMLLVPLFVLYFLKIKTFEFAAFENYFYAFLKITENKGSAAISLTETTIFTRIWYLILMPLPFLYPIKNSIQWFIAIENITLLFIFIYSIVYFTRKSFKFKTFRNDQRFALISSFLLILLFGSYLYNLGLGNRMRVMFFPYIFYFLIVSIENKKKKIA